MLGVSVHRQLEEVDATAQLIAPAVLFHPALEAPIGEVLRTVETHAAAQLAPVVGEEVIGRRYPPPGRGVPERSWRIDARAFVVEHRIALVVGERAAAIVRVGQAQPDLGAQVEGDDHLLLPGLAAELIPVVDERCSREAGAGRCIGKQHLGLLGPVHQVAADRVAPGHVPPRPAGRIVLVEQVVLAPVPDQAVGIVQPAGARGEVVARAQAFPVEAVGAGDGVGLPDQVEAARRDVGGRHPRLTTTEAIEREERVPVRVFRAGREADGIVQNDLVVDNEPQPAVRTIVAHRHDQVSGRYGKGLFHRYQPVPIPYTGQRQTRSAAVPRPGCEVQRK